MTLDIRIDFEKTSAIFTSGETVRGTVRLTLGEEKKVRGVYIRIDGKAYCKWSEGSGKHKEYYIGEELYLKETTYLIGSKEGKVKLPPGTQTYDFQCNLPKELPTSVEADIGYIRYSVCVVVDVPMGFDKELKRVFTVIRTLNLNDNRELREPVKSPICKMSCCSSFFCCFCICMNPIVVAAHIPVGAYTPGQYINLLLRVIHRGSPKNYTFTVKLMKLIDYYANEVDWCDNPVSDTLRYHNEERQCITQQKKSCRITNANISEIVPVNLRVPPVPPTDCTSCKVVKVRYYLDIKTSTGGCNGSPKNLIPITIGTYPIADFVAPNPEASAPPVPVAPTAPPVDSASGDLYDDELPTYEEALDQFNAGDDNFKPKYPVYKRRTSYSAIA